MQPKFYVGEYPVNMGAGKGVKVKNNLDVPVKVIKLNAYDVGTLQPGEEIDVQLDPETVKLQLEKPPTP